MASIIELGNYELEFEEIEKKIKERKYKKILIQITEGLRPFSKILYDKIKEIDKEIEVYLWLGSCFGACDIPFYVKDAGVDLIMHIGHHPFFNKNLF